MKMECNLLEIINFTFSFTYRQIRFIFFVFFSFEINEKPKIIVFEDNFGVVLKQLRGVIYE